MFRVIFVILWGYNSSYPSRFQARNVSIFQLNLGKIETLFVDIILNSLSCNRICSQLQKKEFHARCELPELKPFSVGIGVAIEMKFSDESI